MRMHVKRPDSGFTLLETIVAMAVLMIVLGAAMSSITQMMISANTADRNLLVSTENQRAVREMKNDLYCSSRNCIGPYAPTIVGDELRFRVVTGFNKDESRSDFSGYLVCYWHKTETNQLIRRFRDSNENLMDPAPAEFPGPPEQVICQYCSGVSFTINVDAGMITVTVTNSLGHQENPDYAIYSSQFDIIPFNCD
jgi:prepilin-type N-terminal cleavage/methylation domain-containing protein